MYATGSHSVSLFQVCVVLSDTDSYLLHVRGHTDAEVMERLEDQMDLSNLHPDHPLFSAERAKQPGLLKNEFPSAAIISVCGLKSKSYAAKFLRHPEGSEPVLVPRPPLLRDSDDSSSDESDERAKAPVAARAGAATTIKAKGVKGYVRKNLTLKHFKSCLDNIRRVEVTQTSLQAKNHINRLMESRKVAFDSFDDKRFLLCERHSCPYGSVLVERFLEEGRSCPICLRHRQRLF